ncbi:MAG: thioredoxin family protein [Magnetospirillum sp.]|nr:thioredoxin family protein [Magnetospirillum sp.]
MSSFRSFLTALALLVPATLAPAGVAAAEPGASDWVTTESGGVRLLTATVGDAARLRLGLQFKLEPGWKIYWRSPGDAGYPPRLDWSGSANMGEPRILWPAPKRFVLAGLQNHGYADEVVLPIDAPLTEPGKSAAARVTVDFLACAQICVPQQAALALDLPAGPPHPTAFAHDIDRFAALVPGDGSRHGLTLDRVETSGEGDGAVLRLSLSATEPFDHPDAFVEGDDAPPFEQPRVTLSNGGRRALIEVPVAKGSLKASLAGRPLTVTVADGQRALEATATPSAIAAVSPAATLLGMLAAALLGGMILNLMPCVLPVLSIKVLGALGHGGAERSHVRASFLASAAGIVASFLALAGLAVGVKAAGAAVGWGIQFQQPGFLAVMVALLGLFAANLWGLFEIALPSWLLDRSGGTGGQHHTLLGHFLSGAFATLLATPCSAPFLGTAVGFALARGPLEIVAVFTALGVGMAAPFLAIAVWPDAACRLPRPGAWMVRVKMLMGVALTATGLWLLTVLAVQTGMAAALLAGGSVAAAVAVLGLRRRFPERSQPAVPATVAALIALAVAAPFHLDEAPAGTAQASSSVGWVAFERDAIPRLLAEGKTVFVDVTADWCITCKVNKAAVIERGEVARRLGQQGVVAMRADWTRPDEGISRFLADHGRYGIPFDVVYGPGAPAGVPLSELLTEAETLAALDRAGGPR